MSFDAGVFSRLLPSTKLLHITNAIAPGERRSRDRFGLVALLLLEEDYAVEVECRFGGYKGTRTLTKLATVVDNLDDMSMCLMGKATFNLDVMYKEQDDVGPCERHVIEDSQRRSQQQCGLPLTAQWST